jgi:hypothetical protein
VFLVFFSQFGVFIHVVYISQNNKEQKTNAIMQYARHTQISKYKSEQKDTHHNQLI